MDNQQSKSFQYTYSAKEQAAVKEIRDKYAPREESKLEKLRRLDASVTRKATVRAIAAGVIGALILGLGMSLCLEFGDRWFVPGIVTGVIGMVPVALAYPIYQRTLKKERARVAPEVLRLSDELLK